MTKREKFEAIKVYVQDNEELVEFCDHEIELLEKKIGTLSKAEKAKRDANAVYSAEIVTYLTVKDRPVTIKEIKAGVASLADATSQKISALLNGLIKDGKVQRDYVKKVAYFAIVTDEEEEEEG